MADRLFSLGLRRAKATGRGAPTSEDLDWIASQMKPGEEQTFAAGFNKFESGMRAGATRKGSPTMAKKKTPAAAPAAAPAAKKTRRKSGKRKAAPSKPRTIRQRVTRAAVAIVRAPAKKRRRSKGGGAIVARGGGGSMGSTTEMLIQGGLVIVGAAGGGKLNQMIEARPMGLKPTTIALGISVAAAVVMRKRNRKVSRYAASLAVGLASGIAAEAVQARSGGAGGGTSV